MTKTNDDKILALTSQIREKKEEVGKAKRFSPITNCSIGLYGERYNLNALDREGCVLLMSQIGALVNAAEKLGVDEELVICGYDAIDWLADLRAKYANLTQKDKQQKLKAMEKKLERLLSAEKRTEIEISEIESLLGD